MRESGSIYNILRKGNKESEENQFEPQHGPNDLGAASSFLCEFSFLLRKSNGAH